MADQLIAETQGLININSRKESALMAGLGYGAAALYELTAPEIDYSVFEMTGENKKIQASNIELEAAQAANAIRERFNEAAGNYAYGATKRGVKVGEGSAGANVERSAKALGEDVQAMTTTAKHKAELLRLRGEGEKERGALKTRQYRSLQGLRYAKLAGNIGSSIGAFQKYGEFK